MTKNAILVEIINENESLNIDNINDLLLKEIKFGTFGSLVEFKGITRCDTNMSTSGGDVGGTSGGSGGSGTNMSNGGTSHMSGSHIEAGATITTTSRKVLVLEYTAYAPLARKIMLEIANEAFVRNYFTNHMDTMDTNQVHNHNSHSHNIHSHNNHNGLLGVAIVHKLGLVEPGQISLYISTYSPHRKLGIFALDWIIDAVKERVPVFKKELWEITTTTTSLNDDQCVQAQEERRVEKVWMENKEACCAQKHRNTNVDVID